MSGTKLPIWNVRGPVVDGTSRHVSLYLLGRKKLPRHLPQFVGIGDEDEAVAYVHGGAAAWAAAAGALDWVDNEHAKLFGGWTAEKSPANRIGNDRIDEAILALLHLGLGDDRHVWKSLDWDAMNRLHEKGVNPDPVGKTKSVVSTDDGLKKSGQLFHAMFGRRCGDLT